MLYQYVFTCFSEVVSFTVFFLPKTISCFSDYEVFLGTMRMRSSVASTHKSWRSQSFAIIVVILSLTVKVDVLFIQAMCLHLP